MDACTRRTMPGSTVCLPFRTRDTDACETPACAATSAMVTPRLRSPMPTPLRRHRWRPVVVPVRMPAFSVRSGNRFLSLAAELPATSGIA